MDKTSHSPQVAVIGCGQWGKNHVRNYRELGALKMVCEPSPAGQALARELAPEAEVVEHFESALLSKVEGLILATPAPTHFDLARRALEAGKDVLVEKPMALKLSEGRELVKLAERNQRILMVGHILEYHPTFQKLLEVVRAGTIGELQYLYSTRLSLGRIRQQENVLWSLAPHDVDAILQLVGTRPERVEARGGTYVQPDIPDVVTLQMSFPNNVKAHIFVSWMHPFKERRVMVTGTRGSVMFNDIADEAWLYPALFKSVNGSVELEQAAAVKLEVQPSEALRNESVAFLEAIRTRKDPVSGGRNGLLTLEVLERAEQSLHAQDESPEELATLQSQKA